MPRYHSGKLTTSKHNNLVRRPQLQRRCCESYPLNTLSDESDRDRKVVVLTRLGLIRQTNQD